jgi:hypothetical protein
MVVRLEIFSAYEALRRTQHQIICLNMQWNNIVDWFRVLLNWSKPIIIRNYVLLRTFS